MGIRGSTPLVSVREFEQVGLPPPLDTAAMRERLQSAALRAGFSAFKIRGHRLFAQGVIGVVDVGDMVVEILPKVRSASTVAEDSTFLGDLIRFAGDGRGPALSHARIAAGDGGLLETLLSWAVSLISINLREGLPRRYAEREEPSTSIRGRVDLRRLAGQHPGRSLELVVRHAPLGHDNMLSQAVAWLMRDIARRTRSIKTRALSMKLLEQMAGVSVLEPDPSQLDDAKLLIWEMQWAPVLALARTLLLQRRLDPARGGDVPAVAVLFTLHDLFENAVRRVLARGLLLTGHSLVGGSAGHLLMGIGLPSLVRLKPDFRIAAAGSGATRIVGDAKWKRIFEELRCTQLGEDDAYQVTAYAASLGAERAFIVAPISGDDLPLRHEPFVITGLKIPLVLLGVHLPTLIKSSAAGFALRQQLCQAVAGD